MRLLRSVLLVAVALTGVASVGACSAFGDANTEPACGEIPEGGCIGSSGGGCPLDPTCTGIYTCDPQGTWSRVAICPVPEGGRPDAIIMYPDAHLVRDVDFTVPEGAAGGPGCSELQASCCALSVVLACPSNQCCGCGEVFVCDDGGWNAWGYCDEAGALVSGDASAPDM
jgi:hypothetical protein